MFICVWVVFGLFYLGNQYILDFQMFGRDFKLVVAMLELVTICEAYGSKVEQFIMSFW